jgi:hypothetical protein
MSDELVTTEQAQALLDAATPGPWRTAAQFNLNMIETGSWDVLRTVDLSWIAQEIGELADAQLIAAAPDLAKTVMALTAENERLERWKAEALTVLKQWNDVWVALGHPGKLGDLLSAASVAEIERLRASNDFLADDHDQPPARSDVR